MTRRHLLFAVACLSFSACNRSTPLPASGSAEGTETATRAAAALGDYVIGSPIRHGNLTIFPIHSKTPRHEDRFMTLEEGLKARTVEVLEMGARGRAVRHWQDAEQAQAQQIDSDQANDEEVAADDDAETSDELAFGDDVNRLMVINRGDKPLYLMPGEIIVGGSQDRTIAEETVIAATGEPVAIDVYCVEPGRWGLRDAATATAVFDEVAGDSATDENLAAEANQGQFVAKAGTLSKASRFAVQAGEGQQSVWDAVERTNQVSGATWQSGAFTANYVDKEMVAQLKPYVDALGCPVSDHKQVVGVVVAINGKIETVDVFESTPLFRKLWPQLLKSFALDALATVDEEDAGRLSTLVEAQTFLSGVLRDNAGATQKTNGGLVVSRHETKEAVSFGGGMGGMGMGGFGGAIHASGFAK
ncbi:MAG: ARPP-1 family domain-containing protein [Planctomycetaceae bacterium]